MSAAPNPGKISADKLCELTGLGDRQHRNIANQGYFPPPYKSQYEATKTLQGLFRYFQELNKKKGDTIKAAEARLKEAKADMAEEELAAFREQYVLKSQIGPALSNLAAHQRANLQFKLEQEIAPKLAGKKPVEILQTLQRAVDDICKLFETGIRPWMDAPPEKAKAKTRPPSRD